MSTIKVSIIVPIYNVEKYLRECIDSIRSQTLDEIEIICVNDGSTDESLEILKEYAKLDSRIIIVDKPNSGYGDSLNKGISKATGKYVGIVESDDYIDSTMYADLYENAEKYNVDFVKSNFYLTYGANKANRKDIKVELLEDQQYNRRLVPQNDIQFLKLKTTNWSGLYLNSFLKKNNIMHNITPGASYQDTGFYFQICTLAESCVFIKNAYYHYRQDNPNSSINNKSKVYVITEEYSYIRHNLEKVNKFEDYKGMYFYKKFDAYFYFNYNRIAAQYKIEFLKYMAKIFKEDICEGLMDKSLFSEDEIKVITRIIDDPIEFYANDLIWRALK